MFGKGIGLRILALLLLLLFVLGGCWPKKVNTNYDVEDIIGSMEDTRVMTYAYDGETKAFTVMNEESVEALNLGNITRIFASGVIDKGFDMLGAALRKAAGLDAVADATVMTGGYMYANSGTPKEKNVSFDRQETIAVVHGTFGNEAVKPNTFFSQERQLASVALNSSDERFMLINRVEYSDHRNAMRLVPEYLFYNKGLAGRKDVDVVVHFTFRLPGNVVSAENGGAEENKPRKSESKSFAGTTMVFKGMEAVTQLTKEALQSKTTEWMPLPVLEVNEKKAQVMPYVLEVQIVETEEANELLKLMSEAFESKKDELKQEVQASIKIEAK